MLKTFYLVQYNFNSHQRLGISIVYDDLPWVYLFLVRRLLSDERFLLLVLTDHLHSAEDVDDAAAEGDVEDDVAVAVAKIQRYQEMS